MGKQMRIEWACDTPSCTTIEENVQDDMYRHAPPVGWSMLTLALSQIECECECHDYDYDEEDEDEGNIHDEEDCPTCPPESTQGQISICPKCTQQVQSVYFKSNKGGLL